MKEAKRVYIDLDDTIANFGESADFQGNEVDEFEVYRMYEPGFFF
jgi:hypothetical protein